MKDVNIDEMNENRYAKNWNVPPNRNALAREEPCWYQGCANLTGLTREESRHKYC
jgi:hypothetical protein